jgi:NADH-quinone oxidoreductase subunit L
MDPDTLIQILGSAAVACPALLVLVLGGCALFDAPLSERVISWLTRLAVVGGLLAALGVLAVMVVEGDSQKVVHWGNWIQIEHEALHYHFSVKFVFDRLSVPFVILAFVLCGTIAAFADAYLHREQGFSRFFMFYALFLLGMVISALAGSIETLFTGWELVGLSSALLVAFFQERPGPVRNGQRVWTVYRISDAAFLMAAIALHHFTGEGDFAGLMGSGPWPAGTASLAHSQALFVGLLLLVAAAGKSALVPFSGWLPRAMEGPTPSSAIFYGALSVHLGAYLLLRVGPVLEQSLLLSALVVLVGAVTAIFASLAGRVQTDIKAALSFASLTQVGIIVVEIGLGLRYIALVHLLGHACLRTLQFLRAPSLLQDYRLMENAIGDRLSVRASFWSRWVPSGVQRWFYRLALERGYLDAFLNDVVARPFLRIFSFFDRCERKLTDAISGGPSRESDRLRPTALDELP